MGLWSYIGSEPSGDLVPIAGRMIRGFVTSIDVFVRPKSHRQIARWV